MHLNHGDTLGSFIIDKPISQGGMSHIYLATPCDRPDFKVILKINSSEKRSFRDLLRREATLLVTLRHPSLVRIYPLRLAGSKRVFYQARAQHMPHEPWYFAMEYITGGGLETHLTQIMQFPVAWRIELFYQILLAVKFMHSNGYAHCDLKPENILLRERPRPDKSPQPVLIDFGSISAINRRERLTLTPDYAPPELIRAAKEPDNQELQKPVALPPIQGDVWALGAILYELLSGGPLVKETEEEAIAAAILKGEWRSIRSQRPEVHDSLELLVSMMLHPKPFQRPNVSDIIEALEEKIATVAPPRIPMHIAPSEPAVWSMEVAQ